MALSEKRGMFCIMLEGILPRDIDLLDCLGEKEWM